MRKTGMLSCLLIVAMLAGITGCSKKEEAMKEEVSMVSSPSEVFITRIIDCVDHSATVIDTMSKAADDAAKRIVQGGNIYVMDDETITRTGNETVKFMPGGGFQYPMHEDWGGFVAEACDRAGGLRRIQPVPLQGELSVLDVVLVATIELHPEEQFAQLSEYKKQGALIIVFGSKNSKIASLGDHLIDNGLEPGIVPVMEIAPGDTRGPIASIANVINLWTFTAEYVAAVTRQGKMPTLWQSMFVPGAAQRNKKIGDFMFHPDMRIMPVEPGILGSQYVTAVKGFLSGIKSSELGKFEEAGKLIAETKSSGHKVVAGIIGHFMTSQRRMPGFPVDLFTIVENDYGDEQLKRSSLAQGDVWFHIGYSMTPVRELAYAKEVDAKTICVFTPGPTDIGEGEPVTPDLSQVTVYIDPMWKHGDAVVEVPDYDTKILPPSGVVMSTCYWMIIGETLKAQSK